MLSTIKNKEKKTQNAYILHIYTTVKDQSDEITIYRQRYLQLQNNQAMAPYENSSLYMNVIRSKNSKS